MDKLDMFHSRFGKNKRIWLVIFGKNFSIFRETIYLNRVQEEFQTCGDSLDVIRSKTSGNEQTGQSDMVKVKYNCTLTYGTCESLGSVY